MMLPAFLYRGDSDPQRQRRLKESWGSHGFLLTNMASGGDPLEIFNRPLVASLQLHVRLGWERTHFLSFSESYDVARSFAAGREVRRLTSPNGNGWDAAVLCLDTSRFTTVRRIETGIFSSTFPGRSQFGDTSDLGYSIMRFLANQSVEGQPVRVLLVDVVSHLRPHIDHAPDLEEALVKARRDREWLVLPMDPADDGIGLTACLDDACISRCDKFAFG